jgi:hypothetical protein
LGLLDKTIQEGGTLETKDGGIDEAYMASIPNFNERFTLDINPCARFKLESIINEFFHLDE